jgi:hypothetical protein
MQDLRHEKRETHSPPFDGQSEGRQTPQAPAPRGYEPDRLSGYAGDNSAQRGEVSLEAAERS